MRILIFESETPELVRRKGRSLAVDYGEVLTRLDARIDCEITRPYENAFDAGALQSFDAVVFPGSGVAWATDASEVAPLRDSMEAVFSRGLPCFGSCNGLQLAAVVLGGRVGAAASLEVGLARDVTLTDAGRRHPMMARRDAVFSVPAVHRDHVLKPPDGATRLAQNQHSPHQAFAYESGGVDFWGVQYHPELTAAEIGAYILDDGQKFAAHQHLAADLLAAADDEAAAARLGSSTSELAPATRTLELQNWIAHVAALLEPRQRAG